MGKILMIGAFDTKGAEYAFLRERILANGHEVLAMDTGVLGGDGVFPFPVDVPAAAVAEAGGGSLAALRERRDRGEAMKAMTVGAAALARDLYEEGAFDGVIGMGGTGGTTVVTAAMRALPLGVPKLCVSTAAAGDTSPYVGLKDVVLFPSIVDVAGINRISSLIIARAAGAICGMVSAATGQAQDDRPVIAASMFGNTTECVTACAKALDARGYEVLVFHATGSGGKTMESLVSEGLVDAVLDITTTELADNVCGGIFDAGPDRLEAAGKAGIPQLIVPGCIDMVNFGGVATVPQAYRDADRKLYEWNPSTTLMRTDVAENAKLGRLFAAKANAATGPVAVLLPLRGVSILDGDGQPFCDREADQAFIDALKTDLDPRIAVTELDCNINDSEFSQAAVRLMLELIDAGGAGRRGDGQ